MHDDTLNVEDQALHPIEICPWAFPARCHQLAAECVCPLLVSHIPIPPALLCSHLASALLDGLIGDRVATYTIPTEKQFAQAFLAGALAAPPEMASNQCASNLACQVHCLTRRQGYHWAITTLENSLIPQITR